MDDNGQIAALQQLLQQVGALSQQAQGSAGALDAFLEQRKGAGAAQAEDARLDRLVKRAETCAGQLRSKDGEFQKVLSEALGTATNFKARKLKSDYARKLDVAAILKRCDDVLKRARFVAVEVRKKMEIERQRRTDQAKQQGELAFMQNSPPSAISSESSLGVLHESQVTYALREYDDQGTKEAEKQQLRSIAKNAALVQEMATEVGTLLHVQQEDVDRLEDNTDESVMRAIEGVHELSQYKRKQANSGATKATVGTAAVGGLVGIIGGPVGMAIGAGVGGLVGMVAGKGVASVKRRSINAETRRVKALLSAKNQREGESMVHVLAFETQAWSYMQRKWAQYSESKRWTDEYGEACKGAHPESEVSALEARMLELAAVRQGCQNLEEEDEIARIHDKEIKANVEWAWATSKWELMMNRPNTDLAGWEYGAGLQADKWCAESGRNTLVRRRLWSRSIAGAPRNQTSLEDRLDKEKLLKGTSPTYGYGLAHGLKPMEGDGEVQELWSGIHRDTLITGQVLGESSNMVSRQGESISRSERNASAVGDAAMYSERIARAANFSGAVRNMMSLSSAGQVSEVDRVNKELAHRKELRDAEDARKAQHKVEGITKGPLDVADATSRALSDNLTIAMRMNEELEVQNRQLDRTAEAVERGNDGMLRITKRIK